MAERLHIHEYPNGLVLVGQAMDGVSSCAMQIAIPSGCANDPERCIGASNVLSDLIFRGAGARSSKQVIDDLDRLGLQRSSGSGVYHTRLSAAGIPENVLEGLRIYADIVLRPHLHKAQFDFARDLAIQQVQGLDDDPRSRLMYMLRERHWPEPFGRNPMGRLDHLRAMTVGQAQSHFQRTYSPGGTIIAVAGKIDFLQWVDRVQRLFDHWNVPSPAQVYPGTSSVSSHFEKIESEQTHIGIAFSAPSETSKDFYLARILTEVLSGGMSGRLFAEVREKRGLCYSVGINYSGLHDRGSMLGYAGTTPQRAQETLDCYVEELRKLKLGITQGELDRAKVGLKSSLVMSGESTSARCAAIAHDYFTRKRLRTMDEILSAIHSITLEQINNYLEAGPVDDLTLVVLGPEKIEIRN